MELNTVAKRQKNTVKKYQRRQLLILIEDSCAYGKTCLLVLCRIGRRHFTVGESANIHSAVVQSSAKVHCPPICPCKYAGTIQKLQKTMAPHYLLLNRKL